MRIAINAVTLLGDRTGVGTYTRNLIGALAKLDGDNEYRLYYGYVRSPCLPSPPAPNFQNISSRLPGRLRKLLLEKWQFPIEWFIGEVDVLHEPYIFSHQTRRAHRIITLFDLIPLRFPETFLHILENGWASRVAKAVKLADCIITCSQTSRQDIEELLHIPSGRVRVSPLAADPIFRPIDPEMARDIARKEYGLDRQIILHIGRLEPHKNVIRLVEAFGEAVGELNAGFLLVFTAQRQGLYYEALLDRVRALRLQGQVRFVDYVSPDGLVCLINAASVVVFPSLYEGFGLPVLEAMACGTPVITSGTGATREVANGAAFLIDPQDVPMLAHAIVKVVSDPTLAKSLREHGLQRAKRFSWLQVAADTLKLYAELATGS